MGPGLLKLLTGKKLKKGETSSPRHGVNSGSDSGAMHGSRTHAGVECTNPKSIAEEKHQSLREAGVNQERNIASSSRTTLHIKEHSDNQDVHVSKPDGIIRAPRFSFHHLEASRKSRSEAYIEYPPNPCSKLSKRVLPWKENGWQLTTRFVHINRRKCEHLPLWLLSAKEFYHANMRVSTALEFRAAVKHAECLVQECSHNMWLLKAMELWECTEHFVEVLLDLCWSAYIMSLGGGNIERSEKWMSDVEKLLTSRSERNDVARLLYEDYHEIDQTDLNAMVCARLTDKAFEVDCADHQLALLLQDRLKKQTSWQPPFLKRHRFFIYSNFVVPLKSSRKTGAHGAILKFPWVYEKEFALKMRHPNENSSKTFKREYDILDKYRSPFIVGVVGYWEVESSSSWNPLRQAVYLCPFLLMEHLECDLKDLMDRCKTAREGIREGFSELETINLMLPIAKALRFLHGKDVAHRDVKPQNIMCRNVNVLEDPEETIVKEDITVQADIIVKEDTIVKLIDFGEAMENVSCLFPDEWGPAGTPGYMDPPMWEADVVGYTLFMGDVFSFAMVFAELLTWRSPMEAFGVRRLRDAQAKLKAGERPPLPEGLPNYVRFIVESCWCADHLKRPDFKAICSMLQHAKILLLDMEFVKELDELFHTRMQLVDVAVFLTDHESSSGIVVVLILGRWASLE